MSISINSSINKSFNLSLRQNATPGINNTLALNFSKEKKQLNIKGVVFDLLHNIIVGSILSMLMFLLVVMTVFGYRYEVKKIKMLEKHILQRLELGHKEHNIKKDLIKHGWHPKYIERGFEKAELKHKLNTLERYIEERLNQGHKEEHIHKDLIEQGWHSEHIKNHIDQVSLKQKIKQTVEFIKTAIEEGKTEGEIKKILISHGWHKKHIAELIKKATGDKLN